MSEPLTSTRLWFIRGTIGGVMVFAALNALSWFWLSDAWSDLVGLTRNAGKDAIGFPLEIWREGNSYGNGWMINYPYLGLNFLFAVVMSLPVGWLFSRSAVRLQALVDSGNRKPKRKFKLTFSVRGLMIATTFVAMVLGVTRLLGVSPWLLGAVYLFGPLILILVAMTPMGLRWEQRSFIVVTFAVLMLVGSVMVGSRLGMEFDRVLIGVFICWVPQSVIAAAIVLVLSSLEAGKIQARSASE